MKEIGIKIIGSVYDTSVQSKWTREFSLSLYDMGMKVKLEVINGSSPAQAQLTDGQKQKIHNMANTQLSGPYVVLHMYNPFIVENNAKKLLLHLKSEENKDAKANIVWNYGETNQIPFISRLILEASRVDEVWVPTEEMRGDFRENSVLYSKVKVVPFGVDTKTFSPNVKPMEEFENKDSFTFFTESDLHISSGWDLLIRAFYEEFNNNEDARLVFKANLNGANRDEMRKFVTNHVGQLKGQSKAKVIYIDNDYFDADLASLYNTADCAITVDRFNHGGFFASQVMATGKTVLVPESPMFTSICNKHNSVIIKGKFEKIKALDWLLNNAIYQDHSWFEVDYRDLRRKLRWAYSNKNELKGLGEKALEQANNKNWDKCVLNAVKALGKFSK